ncbi:BrnT family toxin [Bradyrhizobium sp. SZCCHNRI1003]|uniref:BrnT family toxin n=1 Tax=Bradyrhizobium sp. SZCCHNRI1003 TaxID=3057275 RepID=UPI002916C9FB|nr:BrnT family toxin [Bradyrhizobium sp. SZCCHNRI1003]
MKIVWDEPKRLANLAKHGLDFADLTVDFFEAATVYPSRSNAARWIAIGANVNGTIVVVFARLGREAISVISMRPASRNERKRYEES